ncbi:MBL fold metallo-hydrolase [Chloroflexota bacterium]
MKIRFLGTHNSESEKSRLSSLIIDDRLVVDAGALSGTLPPELYTHPASILITHAHYDHIRDIPAVAMNAALTGRYLNIYATAGVREALASHLLNGRLYPTFLETPADNPIIRFTEVTPSNHFTVPGYQILPLTMTHGQSAVGYLITGEEGKSVLVTGDTGPSLADCWPLVNPDGLITEVTMPNRDEQQALAHNHLTPALLAKILREFRKDKGYLPRVLAVHLNPWEEETILTELTAAGRELNHPLEATHEGMEITV